MHLKIIYKYSVNRTLHKLIVYMANVFLCFVTFVLVLVSIFAWKFVRQERMAVDESLNGGVKQAGLLEIDTFEFEYKEAIESFVKEAADMEDVNGIGYSTTFGCSTDGLEELWEKQKQLQETDDTYLWRVCINQEAAGVCKIDLQIGKLPDELNLDENTTLLYLGSNYADIPVGTKYEWKTSDGTVYTEYVAGILKEGTKWICEDIYLDDAIVDACYVENMDNQILAMTSGISSFRLTYTVKDGYSVKETESKLRSLGEKHGLKLRFGVLEDILDEKEQQHSYIFDTFRKMLIAITITAFFLLLCTQFAEMLDDMTYFGIFYANGASAKDLIAILLGENLLKVLVSYILAVIGVYFAIRHEWSTYQPGVENWENAMEIYCKQTLAPAFLIGVVLTVLATWIPIMWFKKKSPTELIQGYKV